jgi:hypothetical protein
MKFLIMQFSPSSCAIVQLQNKISGRDAQRAYHQDELIGGKPPVLT